KPVVPFNVKVPDITDSETCTDAVPASASAMLMPLPLADENTSGVLPLVFCAPGTVFTGASFTALTLIVIVLAFGSRSAPPLDVPPLSCTWNVKLVYGVPLASGTGMNFSLPAVTSLTLTKSPALTATLSLVRVPTPGNVVIFTDKKVFGG